MEKSRGLVKAFFSGETYASYAKALGTKISIENVPNVDFEEARTDAIIRLSQELGIK